MLKKKLKNKLRVHKTEPAMLVACVQAGLGVLIAFNVALTPMQVTAILAFTPLLFGVITRHLVHSPARVKQLEQRLDDVTGGTQVLKRP